MNPLILCIDRDDDLGRKAGVKGPVVGWKNNLEAAEKLALADPEDTDVNALFAALKASKERGAEIVTLIGDKDIGITSDSKIAEQLDKIIAELKPTSVILVTDGASDEQLIPVIQSRIKIDSIRTVVVRQSQELEKAYFTVTNFINDVTKNPNLARLLFGVPGVVLILLAIGGLKAISYILGIVGAYMVIRGLGFEEFLFEQTAKFVKSMTIDKISTYTYVIALVLFIIGVAYGYNDLARNPIDTNSIDAALNSINAFSIKTIADDLIIGAFVIAIVGRVFEDISSKRFMAIRRNVVLLAFIALMGYVLTQSARFWIEENYTLPRFMINILAGLVIFGIWIRITKHWFMGEILEMKKTIEGIAGKEVYTSDGKKLGKVSKVYFNGVELEGIKVEGKKIGKKSIISTDRVVVVNAK